MTKRELVNKRNRESYRKHRTSRLLACKMYVKSVYARNPDRARRKWAKIKRAHYHKNSKNRKADNIRCRKWRKNNVSLNRELQRKWRIDNRKELIADMGGKCARCGFTDWRALQIDHVRGGGNRERKKFGTYLVSASKYRHTVVTSGKYQLLCANCNWIKRYEADELAFSKHKYGKIAYKPLRRCV